MNYFSADLQSNLRRLLGVDAGIMERHVQRPVSKHSACCFGAVFALDKQGSGVTKLVNMPWRNLGPNATSGYSPVVGVRGKPLAWLSLWIRYAPIALARLNWRLSGFTLGQADDGGLLGWGKEKGLQFRL